MQRRIHATWKREKDFTAPFPRHGQCSHPSALVLCFIIKYAVAGHHFHHEGHDGAAKGTITSSFIIFLYFGIHKSDQV